jgi:hypothetical protein
MAVEEHKAPLLHTGVHQPLRRTLWQEPAAGPYFEPDESISHSHSLFKISFNIILSHTPNCAEWSGLFIFFFRQNFLTVYIYHLPLRAT